MARTVVGTVELRGGTGGQYLLLKTPERSAAVYIDDVQDLRGGHLYRPIAVREAVLDPYGEEIGHATVSGEGGDALHVEAWNRHYHIWLADVESLLDRSVNSVYLGVLTPEFDPKLALRGCRV